MHPEKIYEYFFGILFWPLSGKHSKITPEIILVALSQLEFIHYFILELISIILDDWKTIRHVRLSSIKKWLYFSEMTLMSTNKTTIFNMFLASIDTRSQPVMFEDLRNEKNQQKVHMVSTVCQQEVVFSYGLPYMVTLSHEKSREVTRHEQV